MAPAALDARLPVPSPRLAGGDTPPHERLRQAALRLFVEQGFHHVSLRQLAAAVGLQPGSLYNHMEGKQGLLFELIEDYETDLLDALRLDDCHGAPPALRLGDYVRRQLRFQHRHAALATLARLELRALDDEQRGRIERTRRARQTHLQALLQAAVPAAADPRALTTVARTLQAMLDAVPSGHAVDTSLDELITIHTRLILDGLPGACAASCAVDQRRPATSKAPGLALT